MMHDHPWKQTKLRNLVAYSYEELLDMKNGYHQDTSSRHGPYIVRGDSDDGVLRTVNSKDFPKGVRPRPCVVDLIVPERTVTSIYGAGGVVKSTLVLDLLLCAARGDKTWAGRRLGGQYDCLFIDLELDLDEQANRARRLCWGRGHKDLPEGFNYICGRGHSPQAVFNHAYKDCEEKGFRLVAIDSAGLAIMGNATEYRDVVSFFQQIIDAFIINLGCTVILIDHQGNVQAGESYQAKTQFGSSYKGHLTRSRVQLQLKESGKGIRRITARHNKANFTDYADPFDLTVRYMADAITITAETMDTAELAQEIQLPTRKRALLTLYRENGPMARQDIADAARVSNGTVGNVLTDLRKEEHVRDCGRQPDGTNPVEITPLGIKFVEEFLSEYTNDIITSHPPYKDRDDDDVDDGVDGGGGSPDRDDDDGGGSPTPPTLDIPRDDVVDDAEEHPDSYFRISDESGMYMVKELIASSAGPIAIDTETSSLNLSYVEVALIQVKMPEESNPIIVDCSLVGPTPLLEALKDKHILGHNLAYDLAVLRKVYGYEHEGDVSDTQLMFQVFYGGTNKRAGLQDALHTVLGIEISKDEQTADWMGYLTPEMLTYAAGDVEHLHALKDALAQKISDTASHLWAVLELEHAMVKVTAHMKATGMPVDQGVFAECVRESKEGADKKLEELDKLVTVEVPEEFVERNTKNKKKVPEWRRDKVNWNSPEQVLWAFKEVAGIELKSTSKEVLPEVNHPIAVALMEYRKVLDVSKRFSETKLVDGRVYAGWNQLKARTGRMSCEKPPLQGIPTPLRRAFVAPEGHKLIVSDLS